MFSPYDDLPVPDYLDQDCLAEFENRVSPLRCFLSTAGSTTASLSMLLPPIFTCVAEFCSLGKCLVCALTMTSFELASELLKCLEPVLGSLSV